MLNLHLLIVCSLSLLSLLFSFFSYGQGNYVGSQQCIDCHKSQYQAWQGSHHDMAMRDAKPDSVLGDFNNVIFESNTINYRSPAKVQAALLEAMEERQITVAGTTHKSPDLFMV